MKKQFKRVSPLLQKQGTQLRQLVSKLVSSLIAVAATNRTCIFNEISPGIYLFDTEKNVIALLHQLLAAVVVNSREGKIYINAEKSGEVITLQIEERNNYNGYALAYSVKSIGQNLFSGADIAIQGERKLETTITFSFPDMPLPAFSTYQDNYRKFSVIA